MKTVKAYSVQGQFLGFFEKLEFDGKGSSWLCKCVESWDDCGAPGEIQTGDTVRLSTCQIVN